jgi:CHAT domain-containing protein/Tfp pilus assembly protein PilF
MHGRNLSRLSLGLLLMLPFLLPVAATAGEQQSGIQEAEELNQQALNLYKKGRYSDAIPLAERALAIREKALGPEHPATATSLSGLALLYESTAAYGKAEPLYQRALAIREKALGSEHPATATALSNLAAFYVTTGAYAEAEALHRRALAIREKALGPEHPDTANSLNNLAALYGATGAYAQAESLYQRALAVNEKALGPEHPDTALSLNNLAWVYDTTGAYGQAEPLYQRALAINEKVLGPDHPNTARSLNNLAALYSVRGAYAQAEPLYQRALAIRAKALGPEHPDTAASLNNLAAIYHTTGAYAQAEPLFQRVLAIKEKALGPEHPDTAMSLNNLAELYRTMGAYAQAEPLYRRALAVKEKALGPEHPGTAVSLSNLAGLYSTMGAYAQAEPLYRRALAIREKALGPEHSDTAMSLNNLARLYSTMGAYAQAEPLYRRALAVNEKALGPEHPTTATSLNNLAMLCWAMGEPAAALSLLERAHAIEMKNTARFLLTGSESRKRAYVAQVLGITAATVSLSVALTSPQAKLLGLGSVLEVKGRVLDAMSDNVGRLRESVKTKDRTLLEQLVVVAQQSSALMYQGPRSLSPEMYRQRVDALSSQQAQLEAELSTRSAAFRQQVAPFTLAAVQAAIPKQAAFIEWYRYKPYNFRAKDGKGKWGKPRYVAYVLRHEGEPAVVDVGEAEAIEQLILDFRTGLSDPTSTYIREVATDLYDKLMKPLRPLLGDTDQLLISPDGALNLIPFAALRDDAGAYLSTKVEITYLTSGRDLLRVTGAAVAKGKAVVVANPDYGPSATMVAQGAAAVPLARSLDLDREGMTFAPLPGTAQEAQALSPLLKVEKEQLLTQAQATEAKVKQLHGPRILHIATHGFFLNDNELPTTALRVGDFSPEQPPVPLGENPLLRSGLALAGANTRRSGEHDDGILTAAEVAQMDLRGTQLVVLSACETGVGEVQNGEGVYGLRRALVLAGAETQVASLWKVADEATKDLMVEYYQRLLQGEGRSAALRAAQRTMITSQTRAHPYYWAAFVPIGHWTPLTHSQ